MRGTVLLAGVGIATVLGACGQRDAARDPPPPPVVVRIDGVVTTQQVTVSPSRIDPGPVVLVVSNRDEDSHTVIVEGKRTREQVGPINPQDTATITAELGPGVYAVRAGSEHVINSSGQVEPARLVVGRRARNGDDDRRSGNGRDRARALEPQAARTALATMPPSRAPRAAED